MNVIVGLGNPGAGYVHTRHNVGFMVVEALARDLGAGGFAVNGKFGAEIAQAEEVLLVKPQTFMNKSGEAVQKILQFYKIPVENLTVVHDDLDIPWGDYKISSKGPRIHNGVNSIRDMLGRDDFLYARIGVDSRTIEQRAQISGQEYILMRLSESERGELDEMIEKVAKELYGRLF